jgi:hypothetical protein
MIAARAAPTPLDEFFENHRIAVLNDEPGRVIDNFSFPMSFCDSDRTVVIESEADATRVYRVLRDFYEDLGMSGIETRWVLQHRVSHDFLLAEVNWRLTDEEGDVIADHRSTYALRFDGSAIKVVAVFLHEDDYPYCGTA